LDISPIWTPIITAEVKIYNSVHCILSVTMSIFCVGTIRRICLSSDEFYSDSPLVLGLINVEFVIF
jgi:hypothetical protein